MTVVLRHSLELEVNRVDYDGAVTMAELNALADFIGREPIWLSYDGLSVISEGAAFVDATKASLDALFATYKAIYAELNFLVLRRSGWICENLGAQPLVNFWLSDHDTINDTSSDARQFCSFSAVGDWLMLTPAEAANLESGKGFHEIARFEAPPLAQALAG